LTIKRYRRVPTLGRGGAHIWREVPIMGTGKQKLFMAFVKCVSALFYCLRQNCQARVQNKMLQQKKQHDNAQRADSKRGFPIGAHIRRLLPMFFHESW